jgi:O-antigen/teichoic acid export membrane protein
VIKKLIDNILIYGFSKAFISIIPILMLPILTRHLSLEEYGLLSIIEISILFITPLIMMNVDGFIQVKYFQVDKSILSLYITNAFLINIVNFAILTTFVFLTQGYLVSTLKIDSSYIWLIPIFSFLRIVSGVVLTIFQVEKKPLKYAFFTLSQAGIDFFISILLVVYLAHGLTGRLYGIYGAYFFVTIYGIYFLYRNQLLGKINFRFTSDILKFCLPLVPHAIGGIVIALSDRYFISYFLNNEFVALYTVSYQVASIMLLAGVSVNLAWTPFLFKMLKSGGYNKSYVYSLRISLLFFAIGIFIFLLKDVLFYIFVDESFMRAKEYFLYLLLGFLFQSVYTVISGYLFFEHRTALLAGLTVSAAILNIILNFYLIIEFGALGAAYATAISWAIFTIIVSIIVYRKKYVIQSAND